MIDLNVLQGDCLTSLRQLPAESVNCCVTSPPYFGLRDYGVDGQIGLEPTPDAYVAKLVEVFREVRRVLRDDGTLWLNIGDSYAGSWGNYGGHNRGNGSQREINNGSQAPQKAYDGLEKMKPPTANKIAGIKPKDLIGVPWMVAFALRADGWFLRQDIIWAKPNPMPESVTDRCTKAHEYIFLLSKSQSYFYDAEAVMEAAVLDGIPQTFARPSRNVRAFGKPSGSELHGDRVHIASKRNRRSVWSIATQPYGEAHFATFPPDLIKPCILAGCPVGGIVLDPFAGSGTTGKVALENGRSAILIELNPEYVKLIRKRCRVNLPLPLSVD